MSLAAQTAPTTLDDDRPPRTGKRVTAGLLVVVVVHLALSITTAWLTPAWEANDEVDHVQYAQAVAHGQLPVIGDNIESAQPPLYYALVGVWMNALGAEDLSTDVEPATDQSDEPQLQLEHHYTPEQADAALAVHWLRMVSVVLGLVTVLCTFAAARLVGLRDGAALAATATVAVWPKFVLVSATVQNDALAVALSSVLVVLVLRWVGAARRRSTRVEFAAAAATGAVAGAAALSKYTTLPLVGLMFLVVLVSALRHRHWSRLAELATAGAVVALVLGWWVVRNVDRYGDPLASRANTEYLRTAIPGLAIPAPLTDGVRFGEFVPRTLLDSTWYIGGWNQFLLPFGVNLLLTMAAAAAVVGAARVSLRGRSAEVPRLSAPHSAVLWTSVVAAFAAVVAIALETTQAQGRYLLVAVVPIALLLVMGTAELADVRPTAARVLTWLWPTLFILAGAYASARYLIPFAGL